ncbi:hypothetical protein [Streptomyces sp. NPDC005538]|uniref:hypothetical protein n=1 Tax=unclassified Streptomyces TaxID=2593676 RepID=UPI0033BE3A33
MHFDAVRIEDVRGEVAAAKLIEAAGGDAGPIVCEVTGWRWMYFLLAPGEVRGHNWPLRWYSEPTVTAPFVEAEQLRDFLENTPP